MWEYIADRRDLFQFEAVQHAGTVAQCVLIAAVAGVVFTVPSLALLGERLTDDVMRALNAQVDVDGGVPVLVAKEWLVSQGFVTLRLVRGPAWSGGSWTACAGASPSRP
ncbi:hypothetical protein [Spongiactinospora sp. 9N601]|uniref:hypothetical protein n=1 Tax=Spongiactinospora sp. 9N601 TaxID=3375149 RepID=UPI0037CC1518